MEMSRSEIKTRYKQLQDKRHLSGTEAAELAVCEAVLFNGGKITTTRDHTEPKRRKDDSWLRW